ASSSGALTETNHLPTITRRTTMSEPQWSPLPIEERVAYAHRALKRLSDAWTRKSPNLSGMRAMFRRWRPETSEEPSAAMREYMWALIGSPCRYGGERPEQACDGERKARRNREYEEEKLIDQAATVVAVRAAAWDHPEQNSHGQALYNAGLRDM